MDNYDEVGHLLVGFGGKLTVFRMKILKKRGSHGLIQLIKKHDGLASRERTRPTSALKIPHMHMPQLLRICLVLDQHGEVAAHYN
jgi:hypothetical protein